MWVLSYFSNNGLPVSGLAPSIRIRDIFDNSLIITDDLMEEVGDGFYKYDFSLFNVKKNYAVRCDGGSSLSDGDRFVYSGNECFVEEISKGVWEEDISAYIPGTAGHKLNSLTPRTKIYSGFGS